eukprot:CAMPEP_0182939512 /NCGR_PEP_ID=MMETSP0105_2-20130417/45742_1 /TAXON_ID=81532 ORGANISM="Acanthoeca-like sp., Strain 10tr" /NCGR_SAMPLE_ID=MMETSP0105_2 /ASSEMBLY_ACC=CAM_ASM_000205 /LENGTH=582 /DNA_ID=CAMNT_0025078919 /DNA_START=95 /DNA_END=1843 /DNA_ORIENTATION=+
MAVLMAAGFVGGVAGQTDHPTTVGEVQCGETATGAILASTPSYGGYLAGEHSYSLTIPDSVGVTLVTLSTCGSQLDTVVRIFDRRFTEQLYVCQDCGVHRCGQQEHFSFVLPSAEYSVLVEGHGRETGIYTLSVQCSPLPPPDGVLACGQTAVGRTNTTSGSVLGFSSPEHIYTVEILAAAGRQQVTFDSCSSGFDTVLRLYNADLTQQLAFCDDCGPCGLRSVMPVMLEPGTYALAVEGFRSGVGRYEVEMRCAGVPAADHSTSYRGPIVCGQEVDGSTVGGGRLVGGPAPEVHFSFNVPNGSAADRTVTFSTCGSSFDTLLRIFHGTDLGVQYASCDDCGVCGNRATVTYALPAGNYTVVVEGFDEAAGRYKLEMLCGANNTVPSNYNPFTDPGRPRSPSSSSEGRRRSWIGVLLVICAFATLLTIGTLVKGAILKRFARQVGVAEGEAQNQNLRDGAAVVEVPPAYSGDAAASPNYDELSLVCDDGDLGIPMRNLPNHDPPSFEEAVSQSHSDGEGSAAGCSSPSGVDAGGRDRLGSRASLISVLHEPMAVPDEEPPGYIEVDGLPEGDPKAASMTVTV